MKSERIFNQCIERDYLMLCALLRSNVLFSRSASLREKVIGAFIEKYTLYTFYVMCCQKYIVVLFD
ncbi:MAG: IS1 family transposase [Plesiomonas shigelloides]